MSEASRVALLLADVDGTLLTRDKVLTARAQQAVRDMRTAGIRFAITSGRPPRGMRMLVQPLEIDVAIAGFNGGALVNPDLSVIETRTLDPGAAQRAAGTIAAHGMDVWVYTATEWLIRDKGAPHVEKETRTVQFEARVVPEFTEEHFAASVKIVGVSDDFALVERCEQAAREALGGQASAARSQPYYLDVTHPEANKGAVVQTLSRLLSIPAEAIATIGDMPNDVLMFRRSGFSIAMGHADDAVKTQASAVTGSNEEEGFAVAVERYILPRAAR